MYLWAVGFGDVHARGVHRPVALGGRAVYTQLLCSVVRRVRDKTWPDPRGIWGGPDGEARALLALVLFATWVGMGMLGHALEAREKEKSRAGTETNRGASCGGASRSSSA